MDKEKLRKISILKNELSETIQMIEDTEKELEEAEEDLSRFEYMESAEDLVEQFKEQININQNGLYRLHVKKFRIERQISELESDLNY